MKDYHINENQTQALSHERGEVEASTRNCSNDDHMVGITAKNGVEIHYHLAAVSDCHIDENRTQALSHRDESWSLYTQSFKR